MRFAIQLMMALFLFLVQSNTFGQSKQICITIDDLPVVNYGVLDSATQIKLTERLLGALINDNIPAIGFVNEGKLYDQGRLVPYQYQMLKSWVDNGLALGNHSYSHFDYNTTSFTDYSKDILKGEPVTKKILEGKGKTLKYFRHPFLHVGNTREKADSLSVFLFKNGYTAAPVTIDNEEYIFAYAYHKARLAGDQNLMAMIAKDYIDYMEKMLHYFEKQSERIFGRNISQILLLHANMLNADHMEELIEVFRNNGYQFVTLEQALEDELYQTPITTFGNRGISWIDRWALGLGKNAEFFKDEPATPDYIRNLAGF